MGGPVLRTDLAAGPAGVFVPISRSVLMVKRDLTAQPSFGESFFLTVVHEFGHTLGLQHTLTSSAMSTGPTRAATKSKPWPPMTSRASRSSIRWPDRRRRRASLRAASRWLARVSRWRRWWRSRPTVRW